MSSKNWMIDRRLNWAFEKMARQFTKDVGLDIQRDYVQSIRKWEKKFITWSKHNSNFDFLLKASDQYGGNFGNMDVSGNFNDGFEAGINISSDRMNAGLIHAWYPRKKGKPFKDRDAFEMMYMEGIYGYNKDIVMHKWYKTKKSIKQYYKIYPQFQNDRVKSRYNVIHHILQAHIIPPKAKNSPNEIMYKLFTQTTSKENLDKKIKPYLKQMMVDIGSEK